MLLMFVLLAILGWAVFSPTAPGGQGRMILMIIFIVLMILWLVLGLGAFEAPMLGRKW